MIMKPILKLFAIVLGLSFLNVNSIINKDGSAKLTLSSLIHEAKAENEDPPIEYDTFCKFCFEPGQVAWVCEEAPQGSCFNIDCMYGVCD